MKAALEKLKTADPDLAALVENDLAVREDPPEADEVARLADAVIPALAQETGFGQAVARGYLALLGRVDRNRTAVYRRLVREAGEKGPTLGTLMAEALVPVLLAGRPGLLEPFLDTVAIMLGKGTYVLKAPLEGLSSLLAEGEAQSAATYLDLLAAAFSQDLSYAQSQHFAHLLPRAVKGFDRRRRLFQTRAMARVMTADYHLVDSLLDGMAAGLRLLDAPALDRFVGLGLARLADGRRLAQTFLSLESQAGQEALASLQVTVALTQVEPQLNRYLNARLGRAAAVRPLSALAGAWGPAGEGERVSTDGRFIFLPDEIGWRGRKEANLALYKCLVRLEAAGLEYETFNFDLEKLPGAPFADRTGGEDPASADLAELELFFRVFPVPDLAADLFTIFEHGRHRVRMAQDYPGLIREALPLVQAEARRIFTEEAPAHPLFPVYMAIALDLEAAAGDETVRMPARQLTAAFREAMAGQPAVEESAGLVCRFYAAVSRPAGCEPPGDGGYRRLVPPFGRFLRPDRVYLARRRYEKSARVIAAALAARGVKVYRAALRRKMLAKQGLLTPGEIREVVMTPEGPEAGAEDGAPPFRVEEALAALEGADEALAEAVAADDFSGPVFWYREWDARLGDYLIDHVRLGEREVPAGGEDFYGRTLERHQGLVKRIRRSFELLKPERLKMLRQWVEGDAFDYRALLDFAIDRRAGRVPSDRLYIKYLKAERDVAVLLLVDLSRSTANQVAGARASVLDVEKEALVLFSEAIQVLGDRFAMAGFSGTGRLGVDYCVIKDFGEALDETVRQRIGAMAPQRGTRMGAAIRHATARLAAVPARIRLLIVLGDGFPNDLDYKQDYAIADTSRAVAEARARGLFVHGITVNLPGDPKLDVLYGNVHHNVISDVRELPDKLWRIYSALTRY